MEQKKLYNRQGKPLGSGTVSHARRERRAAEAEAKAKAMASTSSKASPAEPKAVKFNKIAHMCTFACTFRCLEIVIEFIYNYMPV